MIEHLKSELRQCGSPEKAKILQRFFKTGKGEYGEGDIFLGITMPEQRRIAQQFLTLPWEEIEKLLHSPEHEFRMAALLILVYRFPKASPTEKQEIYHFYLAHTHWINNWDLVDVSAEHIVGAFLEGKEKSPLFQLAHSKSLWERRIAIISSFAFLKNGDGEITLAIAEVLLSDKHDLIHKAVGWMLRELGKRCGREKEQEFLEKHAKKMPRRMLRYGIEHFTAEEKQKYMREGRN
ncbi:MAG: DNA alkylation repair protein [Candidatus Peregrinibacteria bacterium]